MSEVHPVASAGFHSHAKDYAQARPTYPHEALEKIRSLVPDTEHASVLDLGAGTGIMTRLLGETLGYKHVVAVEPVDGMREELVTGVPGVAAIKGSSSAMPKVASGSQDMVIVAMAFHWFADLDSLREIHRVLKPSGYLVLIWNIGSKDRSQWVRLARDCYERFQQHLPRYPSGEWRNVFNTDEARALFQLPLQEATFPNDFVTTRDNIIRFIMSASYISTQPEDVRDQVKAEIEAILDDPANGFIPDAGGHVVHAFDTPMAWARKK